MSKNLKKLEGSRFPGVILTNKLKRSVIPDNQSKRFMLYIDEVTLSELAKESYLAGLTVDEYVRQIIWGYLGVI